MDINSSPQHSFVSISGSRHFFDFYGASADVRIIFEVVSSLCMKALMRFHQTLIVPPSGGRVGNHVPLVQRHNATLWPLPTLIAGPLALYENSFKARLACLPAGHHELKFVTLGAASVIGDYLLHTFRTHWALNFIGLSSMTTYKQWPHIDILFMLMYYNPASIMLIGGRNGKLLHP